ncbi:MULTISPECIES: hypothetical protein [unclassified Novosphingobium]|uniref:hypothetical protein n=1 Tax=unclassified Novosphingobium TaxID=2644732 RepID=UPI0025D628DF|nr:MULTISPECIES: hypothetical protein [unclassified Novosphingobium]HQV02722.1 hypothetical protein [Novosphingobium sp.]
MIRNWIAKVAVTLAFAGSAMSVSAQAAQPIELIGVVKVDKVIVENGKEKHQLEDPKVVVPGDKLLFTTKYRNASTETVRNFVVTNPVPNGVALASDGADAQTVSVDGGKTWGKLSTLTVSDGKGGTRPATAADVTHLRWVLGVVAPGASGALSYNAIVR